MSRHSSKVAVCVALLAGGLARLAVSSSPVARAARPPPLARVDQIRKLSASEAAQRRPVRLEAVVTYYHAEWEMLFVQDATGPVLVSLGHRAPGFPIREGDRVEVQGETVPWGFHPSVGNPRIRPLGQAGLPAARPQTLKEIATAVDDALWIEVRGIVRQASVVAGLVDLTLMLDGGKLKVHVRDFDKKADIARLVDSEVRVRGVCSTLTDEQRRFLGAEMWTPDLARDVVVLEAAPEDAFAQRPQTIESLRRIAFGGTYHRRLRVAGTVTLDDPGRGAFVQDDTGGLFIHAPHTMDLHAGDRVEAVGFLPEGDDRSALENGVLRRIQGGPPPSPVSVTADQALRGQQQARLVKIRGRLVRPLFAAGEQTLVLEDRDVVFNARLPTGTLPEGLASLKPESVLELTGVSSPPRRGTGVAHLQILLRAPEDVVVLDPPSWWTVGRVRGVLFMVTAVFAAVVGWVAMLRRRVRLQAMVIRERLERETALEERFVLAMRGTNDGIWDWDLRKDEVYFSPRWKSMLGFGEEEVGTDAEDWFSRAHPDDAPRLRSKLAAHRQGATPHFEDEHRMRHKDGTYRWVLSRGFALRDEGGEAYRMAGAQTDVTDRRSHDPLTGLANRTLFVERLERAVARSKYAHRYVFAVLFLDLDRFKLVNDSLGHLAGDRLLTLFAGRLEECMRPGDMIARFGGDEFAILIDGVTAPRETAHVAERIGKQLAAPFDLGGHEVFTSASIGIALSSTGYERAEDILRDADTAMYRAKARGRACFEVFDFAMREQVTLLMQTENDLRRALERDELRVHYQPIVDLVTGTIVAVEALVRWQHPERGLLGPDEFVAVAEDTGLIVAIGEWLLDQACREARSWPERFPSVPTPSVCVNLSPRQVTDPDLCRRVREGLTASGLEPHRLVLEITEAAIMGSTDFGVARLAALKELGVQLHLDDFGTGYSSLTHLHRLHVDVLKIDRSFVAAMATREDARAIVRSILGLADTLRLSVIAEGVETVEQAQLLGELGCGQAQGFYFSPPIEASELGSILNYGSARICAAPKSVPA